MTRDDANELAKRITKSWRGGPVYAEWCDYLAGFDDVERASRALDRLREVEPLTFKRFGDEYRALAHVERVAALPVSEPPTPRLTREQRIEILTRNGAPRSVVDAAAWAKEGPL